MPLSHQSLELSVSNLNADDSSRHISETIPLSMMRNGVCIPILWFSATAVSRSHQPGFDAFISRVLNEPKVESLGLYYICVD